jgi:hypothetical protein
MRGFAKYPPLAALCTVAVSLALPALAHAVPTGLSNAGFESNLDGWSSTVTHGGYYYADTVEPATCRTPDGVCVITGSDAFHVSEGGYDAEPRDVTVTPVEGSKMVRLGGPFNNVGQHQPLDRYRLEQTFVVDPAKPVLDLNYNVYSWDYQGFDRLDLRVTLTDADGDVIAQQAQPGFGSGTQLKNTGWRSADIDLTGYENQQVHLRIESGGTSDTLYGFWAYIDAGLVPEPAVSPPAPEPVTTPSGSPVLLGNFSDPGSGQSWITVPVGSGTAQFPGNCMPLTLNVPINPGAGVVSNVGLRLDSPIGPVETFAMHDTPPTPADNVWTGTIGCVKTGTLSVIYDLTEGGSTEHFAVPLGGLVLIDPQGVVYDKALLDQKVAAGTSVAAARDQSAIAGATVRLQRCADANGGCVNVLSADPGIAPNVNPETTGADGHYQWDVSAGFYRVVVTKAGYDTATGPIHDIPPPVLDGHIAMTKPSTGGGGGGGGGGGNNGGGQSNPPAKDNTPAAPAETPATPPAIPPSRPPAKPPVKADPYKKCKKLKSKKRAACVKQVKALKKCDKLKGKKRKACRTRVLHPPRRHG